MHPAARRAVISPERVRELEALTPEERLRELERILQVEGEPAEPDEDGWVHYGPSVGESGSRG